jgi:hypothetical protein
MQDKPQATRPQWVLQVKFPSACSFIVCWFPLSFTTCFGLHGHLHVCRILHTFIFICLRILLRCFFSLSIFTWSHSACFPFVFCSCAIFLRVFFCVFLFMRLSAYPLLWLSVCCCLCSWSFPPYTFLIAFARQAPSERMNIFVVLMEHPRSGPRSGHHTDRSSCIRGADNAGKETIRELKLNLLREQSSQQCKCDTKAHKAEFHLRGLRWYALIHH